MQTVRRWVGAITADRIPDVAAAYASAAAQSAVAI